MHVILLSYLMFYGSFASIIFAGCTNDDSCDGVLLPSLWSQYSCQPPVLEHLQAVHISVELLTKVLSDTHELHLLESAFRNAPGGPSDWLCSAVLPLFLCFRGYTSLCVMAQIAWSGFHGDRALLWVTKYGPAKWLHSVCSKCQINWTDSLWVKSHLL